MGDWIDRNVGTQVALAGEISGSEDQALMRAVKETARAATDFGWLASGDSVLIEPALKSGNPYPATTSPEGIGAMVELLKEKGAGRVIVGNVNRLVVMRLGGLGEAAHAKRLLRNDIGSIWEDRVLNRAYEVFGGIPESKLVDVGNSLPQKVKEGLVGRVSRSDRTNLSDMKRSQSARTQR